jgi:hypothetical protein
MRGEKYTLKLGYDAFSGSVEERWSAPHVCQVMPAKTPLFLRNPCERKKCGLKRQRRKMQKE